MAMRLSKPPTSTRSTMPRRAKMQSADETADKNVDMGREPSEGEASCLLCAGRYGMVAQQGVDHRTCDLSGRVRIDEAPDASIGEGVHASVAVAANHREARGCRFNEDDAEALAGARHREHVRVREVVWKLRVGHVAGKHHAIATPASCASRSSRGWSSPEPTIRYAASGTRAAMAGRAAMSRSWPL